MASADEDIYATLLLNDFYLTGALVLAHSLRDSGTIKKLAVLVTTDTVSANSIAELQKVFDFIIPVERVVNESAAYLHLMNRPDLHSTFTKIALWKQTQFRRIVYVDSDMVALRAPDELFDIPHAFSAAPDIGWPDIFNSGLMVLTPNMGDYYELLAMAERGISFDGADQGLLNMHFKNTFNRLSFTYNVTPSAHYQYLPAYLHFQSSISMAHFIGQNKPWLQGRDPNRGSSPYDEMIEKWWAVYDRHYRESVDTTRTGQIETRDSPKTIDSISQGFTIVNNQTRDEPHAHAVTISITPQNESGFGSGTAVNEILLGPEQPVHEISDLTLEAEESSVHGVQPQLQESYSPWDASKAPPPIDSRPEASNFPAIHYDMSSDPTPFKAPGRYPDPPKNMYYDVPKTSTYKKPSTVFPWEKNMCKATRVFSEDHVERTSYLAESTNPVNIEPAPEPVPERCPDPPENVHHKIPKTATYEKTSPIFPWENNMCKATRVFPEDRVEPSRYPAESACPIDLEPTTKRQDIPTTVTMPSIQLTYADPWQSFTRGNAWDDIPEIKRYIGKLQKNRKGNIQILQGHDLATEQTPTRGARRPSMKLTDFPTEFERPSLPVTPAPIRRPQFWGQERDADGDLPVAEGVPSQEEWDPTVQLEQLARHQSELLANKLGDLGAPAREIPSRSLPFGSELPVRAPISSESISRTDATRNLSLD